MIIKNEEFYNFVEETDPNCELTEKELEDIYKSIYPERLINE